MQTITVATGARAQLVINDKLQPGQTFRLIGRNIRFTARRVFEHKVAGAMVHGISECGLFTSARVCDTAVA